MNLSKTWVKVELDEWSVPSLELVAKFWEGSYLIKAEIFSSYELSIRVFTRFLSTDSSKGSCCSLPFVEIDVSPVLASSAAWLGSLGHYNDGVGSSFGIHAIGDDEIICESRISSSQVPLRRGQSSPLFSIFNSNFLVAQDAASSAFKVLIISSTGVEGACFVNATT